MVIAISASILGAICMALMVITDRLMVGDCYQGKPNQAWFVSSLAGSIFGLVVTLLAWLGLVLIGRVDNLFTIAHYAISLFFWKGLAATFAGAIGIQVLLHYFRCFSEEAHSAAIAAWLAATPAFVFFGMLIGSSVIVIEGMSDSSTDAVWVFGVILATLGLVAFERLTGGPEGHVGAHRKELVKLLALNVFYVVLLKQIFSIERGNDGLLEALALMPYYWLGFAAGMRVMLKKGEWAAFRANWTKRVRYFIAPIVLVEVIGMLVFFFEYVGITSLDPTVVTIIMGSHVFLVYIIDLCLGWLRHWMNNRKLRRIYVGGVRLIASKLPEPKFNSKTVILEIIAIIASTVGIAIVVNG